MINMIKLVKEEIYLAKPFFMNTEETMILSCMQGCMGEVWVNDRICPTAVQLIVADFAFFAGDSSAVGAAELVLNTGNCVREYLILVPADEGWADLIERQHGERQDRRTRYSIKKEGDVFDRQRLLGFVAALNKDYTLRPIDREMYELTARFGWSSDFCHWYTGYEDFKKHGVGFVILHGNRLVAGASAYTWYREGIEIEIDTKKEYRRQGLATICASAIILECLKRGLYPSWDAANTESVALSEKLGYHLNEEYVCYYVNYSGRPR